MEERNMETKELLTKLGIRSILKGYKYLEYAMELCMKKEDYLLNIYTDLYVDIANHFATTRDGVERCIRTAIEKCWQNGNPRLLNIIAGYELSQKPANCDFIDILYRHLSKADNNIDIERQLIDEIKHLTVDQQKAILHLIRTL